MLYNVPATATTYRWLIVTRVGADHWYYGAYRDENEADRIAYYLKHTEGRDVSVWENPHYLR